MFEIINGKWITKEELFLNSGTIVAIQSWEENNGRIWFIDEKYCIKKGYYIEITPCLTVARSWSSGHITIQNKPFVVWDSAKILKSYNSLNIYQLCFLKSVLMQLKKKYSYNDKVSEKKYQNEIIKLPVDNEWNPNRDFMENYIKNIESKCKINFSNLKN